MYYYHIIWLQFPKGKKQTNKQTNKQIDTTTSSISLNNNGETYYNRKLYT